MSLSESIEQTRKEEDEFKAQWALGDYTGESCTNCGRYRVCKCANGKQRCEKCDWVPELREYVSTDLI